MHSLFPGTYPSPWRSPQGKLNLRNNRHLHGANHWSPRPVLEVELDLSVIAQDSNALATMLHALRIWNSQGEHLHSNSASDHAAAVALADLAASIQSRACRPVEMPLVRPLANLGLFLVAIPCEEFALAEVALQVALTVAERVLAGELQMNMEALLPVDSLADDLCLGASTFAIVSAARQRGIPVYRLANNNLVQFGQGARQRRIWTAITDRTSSIAEGIAKDKELTRKLLQAYDIPVPQGRPVDSIHDAWQTAQKLGFPVVVKPRDGNHSLGVSLHLTTHAQVEHAYREAVVQGPVMVEKQVLGFEHRVLIVGQRMVAAARRTPAHVLGDGVHCIAELIRKVNTDPLRSDSSFSCFRPLPMGEITRERLAEQGYTFESVPTLDEIVYLSSSTSLSRGGSATDVTATVHPQVAADCVEAARIIGLDVAGIDVVARDLSIPLVEQQGAIIEVNSGPGLAMHLDPWSSPEPVGQAIVDYLIPPAAKTARIPIIAVRGPQAAYICQRLADDLQLHFRHVGIVTREGVFMNSRRFQRECAPIPRELRNLLLHPSLEVIVFEVIDEQVLQQGLGCDVLDWLVEVTPEATDHHVCIDALLHGLVPPRKRFRAALDNLLPELLQWVTESVVSENKVNR